MLGTRRRECPDFLLPSGEAHLRRVLGTWQIHYNRRRPHACLGPGLPQPSPGLPAPPLVGHDLPREMRVVAGSILGGLHHEREKCNSTAKRAKTAK